MSQAIDPKRCPLCQGDNNCGAARGAGTCWCFSARIPDEVLERVPPHLRDQACVCERCASGQRSTSGPGVLSSTAGDGG